MPVAGRPLLTSAAGNANHHWRKHAYRLEGQLSMDDRHRDARRGDELARPELPDASRSSSSSGFGPGGVADVTARVVGQKLGAILGQTVVVENKPTAGGIVAADSVAKAAPDGYTLLLMTNGNAVSASLFRSLPFDIRKDFAPVSTLGFFDVAIVAGSETHIDSLADMLAYAKAHPGKLDIGTINVGSTQNLAAELFKSMTGMNATIVPFKGSPAVIEALRRNDVQVGFEMLAPIDAACEERQREDPRGRVRPALSRAARRADGGAGGRAGLRGDVVECDRGTGEDATCHHRAPEPGDQPGARRTRRRGEARAARGRGTGRHPAQMGKLVNDDIEKWRKVIEDAKIERQ